MNNFSLKDKQAYLIGMCVECPFGNAVPSCQLAEIRQHPLRERFRLALKMDESQLDIHIDQHHVCCDNREG